ncbi:MAG: hypothetical protein P8X89_15725 [Reinekea sp.]
MDRVNGNPNSADYYNQIHQEDGQHASRPEAGQRFAGGPASGALGNHPAPPPSLRLGKRLLESQRERRRGVT